MAREEIKGSGGDANLEDGLDQASEQTAKRNDITVAKLFAQANIQAKEKDGLPVTELFREEKKIHTWEEHKPDPELLRQIYDSLGNKEIHHKKLLEEGVPTNIFLRLWHNLKSLIISESIQEKEQIYITPTNWKKFSIFWKDWKKSSYEYVNNFASLIDLYLRKPNVAKLIIRWEMISMCFILLVSIPIIALFSKGIYAVDSSNKNLSDSWSKIIFSSAIISCILAIAPIFFFASLWFVNINHIHTSKYFHLCLLSLFTISFIFMCLAVFNSILFYTVDTWWGITNTAVK